MRSDPCTKRTTGAARFPHARSFFYAFCHTHKRMKPSRGAARRGRLMASVNEAVARGLSLCPALGLQGLPTLCQGGDTISLLRLFHYFPYGDEGDGTCERDGTAGGGGGGDCASSSNESGSSREKSEAGKIGSSPHTDWYKLLVHDRLLF